MDPLEAVVIAGFAGMLLVARGDSFTASRAQAVARHNAKRDRRRKRRARRRNR